MAGTVLLVEAWVEDATKIEHCFWQAIILSKITTAWRGQCSVQYFVTKVKAGAEQMEV